MTPSTPPLFTLEFLDAWEAVRRHLLERDPRLGPRVMEATRRLETFPPPPRERATLALAILTDMDPDAPAGRRQVRSLLGQFEQAGLLEAPAGDRVREDVELRLSDLKPEQQERFAAALRGALDPAFEHALRQAAGPIAQLREVERLGAPLRGLRGARLAQLLGLPVALTDRAKCRWLHRLGLLKEPAETRAHRNEALRLLDALAHAAATPLPVVDALLDSFVGNGGEGDATLCGARPQCPACPLRPQCTYGRVVGSAPAEQAPSRHLQEALPPGERPREKLALRGSDVLSDAELLAILLRTGNGKENALDLSHRLLREAGSLERLGRYSVAELTRIAGLGPVKAATIKAALEVARRVGGSRDSSNVVINGARDVFAFLRTYFLDRKKEIFLCLILNVKGRLERQVTISEGTLNQSLVHPREAFQEALKDSAARVVFVHNHPSGDPSPSRDDKLLTERLVKAGDVMGIKVVDHVIVARDSFFSFSDAGLM